MEKDYAALGKYTDLLETYREVESQRQKLIVDMENSLSVFSQRHTGGMSLSQIRLVDVENKVSQLTEIGKLQDELKRLQDEINENAEKCDKPKYQFYTSRY